MYTMSVHQHILENPEDVEHPKILVSFDDGDPMNTIAPFMHSIKTGMVDDTPENRLNAAFACIVQLTKRLLKLENTCLGVLKERRALVGLDD